MLLLTVLVSDSLALTFVQIPVKKKKHNEYSRNY